MVHAYYYLAQEWLKLGHEVTIVAASFTHPRGSQPEVKNHVTEQWIDGIRYLWVPTCSYKPENYFGRARNIIQFVAKTWFGKLPTKKADLVICSSHHPFAIFPARRLAKRFNARLVFEVRDLWPRSLIELGDISPCNPFIWMMQKAENYAYRNSDHVVSVLSSSKSYMIEHGMAPDKFSFIPNGVSIPENSGLPSLPALYQRVLERKDKQAFWLGFAGRLNNAVALHHLVEAVSRLKNTNVKLFILGDGEKKSSLEDLVRQKKLEHRVVFFDAVKKSQVATFLSYMDAVYLGLQRQSLFRFGISPTKLNDYMLAAKPVIYAIDAPDDPVAESGCGISCEAENAEEIAKAIDELSYMNNQELEVMGQRGQQWLIENRDYAMLAKRFLIEAGNIPPPRD
jgi:glycosyltransferase involved in cell wall biosynthesis